MHEFFDIELACDLEKDEGAGNIDFDYGRRIVDAAIHVRLGGEMNDGVAAGHGSFDGGGIANITLDETVVRIARDGIQVCEITRIGQFVVVNDGILLGQAQEVSDEIRSDEAGAPGEENLDRAASSGIGGQVPQLREPPLQMGRGGPAQDERVILWSLVFALALPR